MTTAIAAGQRVDAADINAAANAGVASVQSEVAGQGSTTSTSYTATLTGVGGVSQAFVAPPSGRVNVAIQCGIVNTTLGGEGWVSFEVRTGSVIGSGSVVSGYGAADIHALRAKAASTGNDVQFGTTSLVTGLTPGSAYHVRQMYRIGTSGGGTVFLTNKVISVCPVP